MDIDKLVADALAEMPPHRKDMVEALFHLQQAKLRIEFLISYYQGRIFKEKKDE
jgi:hypothetical protein